MAASSSIPQMIADVEILRLQMRLDLLLRRLREIGQEASGGKRVTEPRSGLAPSR